jgi:phosphatidylglycerol---prolipoprotein diacylglyceryl transferase
MHPTLFSIGELPLPSYGFAIALGFLASTLLGARAGQRQGLGAERILDMAFWMLIGGLIGSRVIYVITTLDQFESQCRLGLIPGDERAALRLAYDCARPLFFWEGGLVYYGGALGALVGCLIYTRRKGMSFLQTADALAPGLALGHFFGRLGCHLAGCCYGMPTRSAMGIRFPTQSAAYLEMFEGGTVKVSADFTPPLIPTQLLESGAELAIFFLLIWFTARRRAPGQVLACYLGLYAMVRFTLELFRADPDRGYPLRLDFPALDSWLGRPYGSPALLSTSQLISLGLLIFAIFLWRWISRQSKELSLPE